MFRDPEKIGLDNYLVGIFSLLIAVLEIFAAIINISLNLGLFAVLSTLIPAIIFTAVYLYSRKSKTQIISKFLLTAASIALLDFHWVVNFGMIGSIPYLFVILQCLIILLFSRRERIIFTVVLVVNVSVLYLIEFLYPGIFGAYPNHSVHTVDLYLGLLINLFIVVILLNVAIKFYASQKNKAEEADRLKSAFLANMSHEIRTPMNGILGFAEILKKPKLTSEEQLEYISIIENSGARMLNTINDIVDISKIESGLMSLDITDSNINEQIEFIYTFFKPEIEAKGIQLAHKKPLPLDEAIVQTDREKVFAILTNLIKNAIKFTDRGSIEFGYVVPGSKAGSASKAVELQFYVSDTGIGIPKERHEAIFERFIQADIIDVMARDGAGLGLSITKAYVEMLGGKIWVESEVGVGSTFYFTLPFHAETEKKSGIAKVMSSVLAGNHMKKLNVLIVEDDVVSEKLISLYIKEFSPRVFKARTGVEAVELFRNNTDIDLVLMDIKLPDLSGYEASIQIRQLSKDVVIIAQTAYGLSGDREKAIEAGCNDYISKPINKDKLFELINKYF